MKPSGDAQKYYKEQSNMEKQREDERKILQAQQSIREKLGMSEPKQDQA